MDTISAILEEDQNFLVGLVPSGEEGVMEVVKVCKTGGVTELEIQNEFNVSQGLNISGVRKAKRLGYFNNRPALFLEFIPGISLAEYLSTRRLPLEEALNLAIGILSVLQRLHQARIIHKDINPRNIILKDRSKDLYLIDFAVAGSHALKVDASIPLRQLEGTLPYISPEQTGRINFAVDFRSDYYSYGILLYQIFTGVLPCVSTDPVEQVHFHLAQKPRSPQAVNPDVPAPVAAIILKLLAKNPGDRYQSCAGILYDLNICQNEWVETGHIEPFRVGEHDSSAELRINTGIYGREKEVDALLNRFEQVSTGRAGLVLVGGYSGIGKTTLVEEIVKPVFMRGGSFLSGKFDQYRRDIPYSAIIQALAKWVDSIMAEDEIRLADWKQVLREALDENGAVVTNLVPGLDRLMGPQPPVPDLNSDSSRIRFNNAISRFFRTIARPEAPFVLFLDDMQWADYASLEVLKLLFHPESDLRHFLVICAYRDNELTPGHPFLHALSEMEHTSPLRIALGPLQKPAVVGMLTDIFHGRSTDIDGLAELFLKKTQGNPFFIKHFLESLKSEQLLVYSTVTGQWRWDLDQISRQSITENVADLLTKSLSRYDPETRTILQAAGMIGGSFNLHLLAAVLPFSAREILERLQGVLDDEVVLPSDGWQKSYFIASYADSRPIDFRFRFGHDKIRDHVYSGIPNAEKEQLHLLLGRIYLEQSEQEQDVIFNAAGHLNKALGLLVSPAERLDVARLNLKAGQRAKAGGAYLEALDFFQTGIALLPAEAWKLEYDLTLALHSDAALAAYSGKNFDLLFRSGEEVFRNARQPYDKLSAIKSLVFYYDGVKDDKDKVLALLREFLKELQVRIGQNPGNLTVLKELIKVKLALRGKSDDDILGMPLVSSPNIDAALQLMTMALPSAYRGYPLLYAVLVLESLLLGLKNGHSDDSAFHLAVYGVMLFAAFGDVEGAKRFSRLSLELQDRVGTRKSMPQAFAAVYAGIGYFIRPAAEIYPEYGKAFQAARENGNNFWAAIHLALRSSRSFWTGVLLPKIWETMIGEEQVLASLNQKNYFRWVGMVQQAVACLQGMADDPANLNGRWYDDSTAIEESIEGGDTSIFSSYYAMKYYLACLFDEPEKADVHAALMQKYLQASSSEYPTLMFMFYEAVFAAVHHAEGKGPKKRLALSRKRLKFFRNLAAMCPDNFAGKNELIEAAVCWADGHSAKAEELFAKAARTLGARGFLQEKALALELAGRHALQRGLEGTAGYYLSAAAVDYANWGATGKVKHLINRYGKVLDRHLSQTNMVKPAGTGATLGDNIDFLSILRASKAMLEEIELDRLLEKLMRIVLENGGATRGLILLERQGKWSIEGAADTSSGTFEITVLEGLAAEGSRRLAESVANYVIRTREPIVLGNAPLEGRFANDPYIAYTGIPSILCLPLINQGKLTGVLYLENNLAQGAFTEQQLEVLKILSSEIAVSIENARLYFNLNSINKAYERFVPRQFLSFLNKSSITDLHLGDQVQKNMAVLFADIRNFTALSEKFTPEANFNFINDYLGKMEPAITKHHGFIDKYIGDEIMALYPTGAEAALNSAIAMLEQLRLYNEELAQSGLDPIQIGIGINSGSLMLGIIGGENRWDGTVISDAVNLASRIEDLTREYSVSLLISEFAWAQLEAPARYAIREIDHVKVKGKSQAVTVYEVFDADPVETKSRKQATLDLFKTALADFRNKHFAAAFEKFKVIADRNPDDKVVATYIRRCDTALHA